MNVIEADSLTKHYRVYNKPIDRLKESIRRRPYHHLVTSLQDVSFHVASGETIGIIGENGAGKSTLLKILAGTVQPTNGRLIRKGRIAALLELGSGFNPEFSGRTNIHLNAALLGLTEKEIRNRESQIIAFSELEEVIDRPVKTYSSGMYVRLAFSIATSVDPDILIIDEALAVGDQRFSNKCVERITQFREAGKTILLCTHSMFLINVLCDRCIWLDHGKVRGMGQTSSVVSQYLAFLEDRNNVPESVPAVVGNLPEVLVEEIRFLSPETGQETGVVRQFNPIDILVKTKSTGGTFTGHIGIQLYRQNDEILFCTATKALGYQPLQYQERNTILLRIPKIPFAKGVIRAKAIVVDQHQLRVVHEKSTDPLVIESDHPEFGLMWMEHEWIFEKGS